MSSGLVVGLSGNITRPSKTKAFVDHIAALAGERIGAAAITFDLEDLGPSLATARRISDLDAGARQRVTALLDARVVVVASPTYKGSYTGLFKHLIDLFDPGSLRGKPVILAATGGGDRHSLIVEHQLRPLFGFFEALTIPTGIYAADRDFTDGKLASETIEARVRQAVEEAGRLTGAEPGLKPVAKASVSIAA